MFKFSGKIALLRTNEIVRLPKLHLCKRYEMKNERYDMLLFEHLKYNTR